MVAFLFHNLHEDRTCTEAEEAVRQACWIVQEHTTGSQEQETETFWEAAGDFSVEPNTGGTGGLFWGRAPRLPVVVAAQQFQERSKAAPLAARACH